MNWTRKTAPTLAPVDLAMVKQQCRVVETVSDEDAVLAAYTNAAVA